MPGIFDPKAIYSKKYVAGIKHKQEQHRRNLANMKPTIVIKPPRKLPNCRNTRRETEKVGLFKRIQILSFGLILIYVMLFG